MKPSAAQLRKLERDNLKWPGALALVPRADWPPALRDLQRFRVFRSRCFLVQLFHEQDSIIRMSTNRTDWDYRRGSWREDISWDDLQRLKREAGYGCRWAVEVYPTDSEIVNVANMRHLWMLTDRPTYAWCTSQPLMVTA